MEQVEKDPSSLVKLPESYKKQRDNSVRRILIKQDTDNELKSNLERRRLRIAEKTQKVQTEYFTDFSKRRSESQMVLKKKKTSIP